MKNNKKANIQGSQVLVMSIITIAIVLAIGLIVLSELTTTEKEMNTISTLNESVAQGSALVSSGALFVGASACRNFSHTAMVLGVTCNVTANSVTASSLNASGANVYVDYSHYEASAAYNSTNTIITKLATVPTWIGIIIVVALAFLVLSYFYGNRQN